MTQNLFLDKNSPPTPSLVAEALGPRARYLDELKGHVPGPLAEDWKYYGKTIGWTLKLLLGQRNLCFVVVCKGYFAVSFVFGDKAVRLVEQSRLPPEVVQELVNARRYAEGRGIRLEVKSRRAVEHAKVLLDIKRQ
jgi:hypothetical protein